MWATRALLFVLLSVMAHAVACRLSRVRSSVVTFLGVGGLGGAMLAAHELSRHGFVVQTLAALLLYLLACELYLFLFTLASSSVSASLLIHLRTRALTEADIERAHSAGDMVQARIDKLVAHRFLCEQPGGYTLTPKGRRLVMIFRTLRRIFRQAADAGPASVPPR
jgi:hypothetical protein